MNNNFLDFTASSSTGGGGLTRYATMDDLPIPGKDTDLYMVDGIVYVWVDPTYVIVNSDSVNDRIKSHLENTEKIINVTTWNDMNTHEDKKPGQTFLVENGDGIWKIVSGKYEGFYKIDHNNIPQYIGKKEPTMSFWIQELQTLTTLSFNNVTKTLSYTDEQLGQTDIIIKPDPEWSDYILDGTYIQDLGEGKHQYTKDGVYYYRLISSDPYNSYRDAIYSDLDCTNLIVERG